MAKPSFHDEGKGSGGVGVATKCHLIGGPVSDTTFTNLILPKLVARKREVSYELQRGA